MGDDNSGIPTVLDHDGNDINMPLKIAAGVVAVVGIAIIALVAISVSADDHDGSSMGTIFGTFIFVGFIISVITFFITRQGKENQKQQIRKERREQEERDKRDWEILENQRRQAVDISAIKAKEYGDVIIAGAGAIIINRSNLVNALNNISANDSVRTALTTISGFVDKSSNTDAVAILNELNAKIAQGDSKITLKSLWHSLLSTLPEVSGLDDSATKLGLYLDSL